MDISATAAFVTGANRGFGWHLASQLVARGATVYAGARNLDTVDVPGAKSLTVDITDPSSVDDAAKVATDVTLLINNAGSSTVSNLLTGDIERIRLEMNTHYFGTLSVVRAFAPIIAANGGGAILNVLSVMSWLSVPRNGAYCAAKSAEWAMTNALRQQLAAEQIRVIGLHVSYMDTEMTAALDIPKENPADIARLAIDGIEDDRYEIVADSHSQQVLAALSGGVEALYPELA